MTEQNNPWDNYLDFYLGSLRAERNLSGRTLAACGRDAWAFLDYVRNLGLTCPGEIQKDRRTDCLTSLG
jgi:site-specific recombinase XerC